MNKNMEILEVLEKNPKISVADIAVMIDLSEEEVASSIAKMEKEKIIVGYNTLINWERTERDDVTAIIEVKVTPKKGVGFEGVAHSICKYEEVKSCSLLSGGFDMIVTLEGKTMKEVALFVAEKLAVIDGVVGTATHFVLKKYKDAGIDFENNRKDNREVVVL